MLTRLKVTGFKNLTDVDLSFGPFTCIAGANGVGKSNLFDAIRFLSALADQTFMEAARSVRDESGRTGDVRGLFHRVGDQVDERMSFTAEMIVPRAGTDDLGQQAEAKATFLRYRLDLGFRKDESELTPGNLELLHEELTYIRPSDALPSLPFPHAKRWRDSAVRFYNQKLSYITTAGEGDERKVHLQLPSRGQVRGQRRAYIARQLPRTVLSDTNASEGQTALLARREMQSWRLLQLEPTALRRPDEFSAPPRLGANGSHLPATLYRLARAAGGERVYEQVANRLHDLIQEIRRVGVDRDEKRELLTLIATDRQGTPLPARALSDGTLRFLALTVLELDPQAQGVICFEEPENGIHPDRIPAIMQLLQEVAVDPERAVDADNPLRQVIVNTHSPGVVGEVYAHDLLYADTAEQIAGGGRRRRLVFSFPPGTWREEAWRRDEFGDPPLTPPGQVAAYLSPIRRPPQAENGTARRKRVRVADHPSYSLFRGFEPEA